MRLGQPVQFFYATAQTHAKNLTPANGNQRMR